MAEVSAYVLSANGGSLNRQWHKTATIRAAAATTTSYVASSHVDLIDVRKVNLLFAVGWVDSTSCEYYVEWSDDASNWYRSINVATAAGVNTVTANNQTIAVTASVKWADSFEKQARYMRVAVKKTGGVGADTLAVFLDAEMF